LGFFLRNPKNESNSKTNEFVVKIPECTLTKICNFLWHIIAVEIQNSLKKHLNSAIQADYNFMSAARFLRLVLSNIPERGINAFKTIY
jgi:hypothetical protein